jgi:YVTN family beta-propeller protein
VRPGVAATVVESVATGRGPWHPIYDPDTGDVYVPNFDSTNVSVINGTTLVGSVPVSNTSDGSGWVGAGWATYDNGSGDVYLTSYWDSNVTVVNGTHVVGTGHGCAGARQSTFDDGNNLLYEPCIDTGPDGSGNITVISDILGPPKVVAWAGAGDYSWAAAYDSADGLVYVMNWLGSNLTVVNGTEVVGSVGVGAYPCCATFDGANGYLYVVNAGVDTVSVIAGTRVVATVEVGPQDDSAYPAVAPAYDDGNGDVYVPNSAGATVSVLRGTENVATIDVGESPTSVVYDDGNGLLYVVNSGSDNVSIISGTRVVGSVNVGAGPEGGVYDAGDGFVYVANTYSSNVSVLVPPRYPVTFTETGLPTGTGWWVNVTGGPSGYSSSTQATFLQPVGTFSFLASTSNKSYSAPGGQFTVNASGGSASVTFSRPAEYPVSFVESGLPDGTNWSVAMGSGTAASTTDTIGFAEPNGSYPYRMGVVAGWNTTGYVGSITVRGGPAARRVLWEQVMYTVTFAESGLPPGTGWSVVVRGVPTSGTNDWAFMDVPNGTYAYSVTTADTTYSAPPGSLTVDGASVTQAVVFSRVTYPLTFSASGLPEGTNWSIVIGGSPFSSNGSEIACREPNGTYGYVVRGVPGWTTLGYTGSVTVAGASTLVTLPWVPVTYTVTFTEAGLPTGRSWSVTFDDATQAGIASVAFLGIPNGTYRFRVRPVSGYAAEPAGGSLTIRGPPLAQLVVFSPAPSTGANTTGSAGIWDLSEDAWLGILGGATATLLGVGVLVGVRRRRRGGSSRADAGDPKPRRPAR